MADPSNETHYIDDPHHSIPITTAIDHVTKFADGGCLMAINVTMAIHGDEHTRFRLARKIENYAAYAASEEFAAQYGADAATRSGILVRFLGEPPRAVVDLLERFKPILAARGLALGWEVG